MAAAATGAVVLGAEVVSLPWDQTAPAAGAYAATPPLLRYAPLTGTAAQVLTRIAARTAGLRDDTGTGRWVRTSSQDWYLSTRVAGHTVHSTVMPRQITTWTAGDGSGRSVVSYHQPGLPWTTREEQTFGPGDRSSSWAPPPPCSCRAPPPTASAAAASRSASTPTTAAWPPATPSSYTLVIDPDDGQVLAWEEMLTTAGMLDVPVPSVIGYGAYRASRCVTTDQD